jgi:hypothetical protein
MPNLSPIFARFLQSLADSSEYQLALANRQGEVMPRESSEGEKRIADGGDPIDGPQRIASSAEFVGEFWLGELAECVI